MMISGTMKIEFTTDQKLITDGVPAIDGETKCFIPNLLRTEYPNIEVNFLKEFCKRYNQKDNQKADIQEIYDKFKFNKDEFVKCTHCNGHGMFHISEINRKGVDVDELAKSLALQRRNIQAYTEEYCEGIKDGFEEGFKAGQDLKSNAGQFSLEDMKNCFVTAVKEGTEWEAGMPVPSFDKYIQSFIKEQSTGEMVIECEMKDVIGNFTMMQHAGRKDEYEIKFKNGEPIIYFK